MEGNWIELESKLALNSSQMIKICEKWAIKFWQNNQNTIVLLDGDLGSGKTTFSKGFAKDLGIEQNINSPTFNLLNEYEGKGGTLFHYDLYRLSSLDEVYDLGFIERWSLNTEFAIKKKSIHAIEWSQRALHEFYENKKLQKNLYRVKIEQSDLTIKQDHNNDESPRQLRLHQYG